MAVITIYAKTVTIITTTTIIITITIAIVIAHITLTNFAVEIIFIGMTHAELSKIYIQVV